MTCGDGFSLKDAEFEEWRIKKSFSFGAFRVRVGETPPPPLRVLGSTSSTNPTILMSSFNQ
jgi:hypothetical protein